MHLSRIGTTITLLALTALLAGCCGGGTTTKVESTTTSTKSVGDQLLDLQKAYEKGVVNDKEYNQLKEEIIKKNTD